MGEITSGVFGLNNYVSYFYDDKIKVVDQKKARINPNYYVLVDDDTFDAVCELEEKDFEIDTALEWALASYYSPALVKIRPPEAAAILPENNRQSPLKLAAAVLYKLAEVKFTSPQDTAAAFDQSGNR